MGRVAIQFGGLSNSEFENQVPQGRCWAMQNVRTDRGILEGAPRYLLFGRHSAYHTGDVAYGWGYGKISQNEVQRLALTYSTAPTSGQIELVFDGQTTNSNIPYNGTATQVLTALESLSNIAIGDVQVTGGPWPGVPIDVTFTGTYANTDVALMTSTDNTLNNSATLTPVERIKGGTAENYLVAIKKNGDSTVTMYKVDTSGTFTSVATGLTASDWFFEQYGDRIFAVNATDGFSFFRLGGSWNDGAGTSRPKAPVVPPTFTYDLNPWFVDFSSGWTFSQTGLSGSPTITGDADSINIQNAVAVVVPTVITVTAQNTSTVDYHQNDAYASRVQETTTGVEIMQGKIALTFINNDSTTITPLVEAHDTTSSSGMWDAVWSQFANLNRTLRDNIKKIVFKFSVSQWDATKSVHVGVRKGNVWLNDRVPFPFPGGPSEPMPKVGKVRYAYAYKVTATGAESQLSEEGITQDIPANFLGVHVTVTLRGSSELTTSDRIHVYRQEKASGVWRRLPVDANNLSVFGSANVTSGTTTFVDKWMEEELKDFPAHESVSFANARLTSAGLAIWIWKQCIGIGADRRAWFSFAGFRPSESPRFAPDPDDKASTTLFVQNEGENPDRGRTVYMSDNRAEDVYGGVGQDSCYMVGPVSCYAMLGEAPADASRPRRLPGSRGAVGKRAFCKWGGGIHTGAEDGWWFYSVGSFFSGEDNGNLRQREETAEVRRSWITTLLGSSYSGLVLTEFDDQSWAFNGTKYLYRDRLQRWNEGTFTDSILASLTTPNRTRGFRVLDATGQIHTISASYATDNGTAVSWSYETGVLDGPPTKVNAIELLVKGSPRIVLRVYSIQGAESDSTFGKYTDYTFDTVQSQKPYRLPLSPPIGVGMRYKLLFSGTVGSDEVHSCALEIDSAGKTGNG